ncbi:TPA: hypothetical protein DF272_02835 [Candidatus Falkowbacteria bacterium]|nr:hypothetical protein [Candidatus Falkowbacteria bacterium]
MFTKAPGQQLEKKSLNANQLIAMIDYPPLHSPEAFASYREKFKAGESVEPLIAVPAKIVIEYLKQNQVRYAAYKVILARFLEDHPAAAFFMTGGKHRSAAATILGLKIPCLIIENDNGVAKVHSLMKQGKITGVPGVGDNFADTIQELEDHYFEHKRFWTMEEKTRLMIENGDISK